MFSKILIGISTASVITTLSLGFLLKNQYEENGLLHSDIAEMGLKLEDMSTTNAIMNVRIDELIYEGEWLVGRIRKGEDQKRVIRSQLEVTNNELKKALSDSPEFEAYLLPDPVVGVIDRQLSRLWPKNADGSKDRNASSEADSP